MNTDAHRFGGGWEPLMNAATRMGFSTTLRTRTAWNPDLVKGTA